MNAVLWPLEARFEPLTLQRLDAVLHIENLAYAHPWVRGNFVDSINAGYEAQVLLAGDTLLGYFVAMKGVDEVHLLNITVAPDQQGQGWARIMLDALAIWTKGQGSDWLWLEVRVGNQRAVQVYEARGFHRVGLRKAYYPAVNGQREDALVMSLAL
jgi:ribosomal-protein-alanine N-acetyltransferase